MTRRIVLTRLLALPSLSFAPAPFPRTQARPSAAERGRLLAQRKARLEELKVDWQLGEYEGRPAVYFKAAHPGGNRAMGSVRSVARTTSPRRWAR
jgi:hypothetical protein